MCALPGPSQWEQRKSARLYRPAIEDCDLGRHVVAPQAHILGVGSMQTYFHVRPSNSESTSISRPDFNGSDFETDVAFAETTVFAQTLLELRNAITVGLSRLATRDIP